MGWIRQTTRALAAGREIRIRPRGAWIYPDFSSNDELTLAPVDPADVRRRDLIFIHWKNNNHVIRLVLDTRDGEVLVARQRYDEGNWIDAGAVLGRVIRIEKDYDCRDPVVPKICYDVLLAGGVLVEAWGDYGQTTFEFRAKYGHWEFVLSRDPEYGATDIAHLAGYNLEALQQSDRTFPEEMVEAFRRCFVRYGQYGEKDDFASSYMPHEDVVRIVRECILEYESEVQS